MAIPRLCQDCESRFIPLGKHCRFCSKCVQTRRGVPYTKGNTKIMRVYCPFLKQGKFCIHKRARLDPTQPLTPICRAHTVHSCSYIIKASKSNIQNYIKASLDPFKMREKAIWKWRRRKAISCFLKRLMTIKTHTPTKFAKKPLFETGPWFLTILFIGPRLSMMSQCFPVSWLWESLLGCEMDKWEERLYIAWQYFGLIVIIWFHLFTFQELF